MTGAPTASIATAQFIYVQDTRQLFFDADGNGGASGPVLLATLTFIDGGNQILPGDFYVI